VKAQPSAQRLRQYFGKILYAAFVLLLALLVFVFFLRTSQVGVNGKATFEKVLTGTAYRPYIYRQLLPATANFLAPYVDGMAALRFGRRAEAILGERFFRAQLNGRLFPRQVILILAMMYLSLVGFAAAMWLLVRDLGYGRRTQYWMPPAALLGSTVFFGFGYMYDFTLLFLFTLGLWLLHRGHWAAYMLIFALGTLNKETTILLSLVFALYYWNRMRLQRFVALGGLQILLFGLIYAALIRRFRNNPGGSVEWHLPDQIAAFQSLSAQSPWTLVLWAAAVLVIAILAARGWRTKPYFMRCALPLAVILVPLFLLFGYPFEIRDLLELYPILAILVLPATGGSGSSSRSPQPGT